MATNNTEVNRNEVSLSNDFNNRSGGYPGNVGGVLGRGEQMTLEEAIEKAERTAKIARDREKEILMRPFKTFEDIAVNCSDASYYKKVAEEHEELTELLKECQKYRKEKLLSERTIAKAPFQEKNHYYTGMGNTYYWFVCPCCENDVEPEPKGLEMKQKKIQTYCQYCGQRLLWADAKELEEGNRI